MCDSRLSMLIFNPRMVLDTVIALAPPFSAASATAPISPALGDSFAQIGSPVASRQSLTTL